MVAVLHIGVAPRFVNPSDPAVPPGMTPDTVAKGVEDNLADMRARGWTAEHCPIAPDETAKDTVRDALAGGTWDIAVVGGGLRLPPQNLATFEQVVNAIRSSAPNTIIAFNTGTATTTDAVLRWMDQIGR